MSNAGGTEHYVVTTIHEGSDWCVRKATDAEIEDPDEETLTLKDACDLAYQSAREMGCRWFDFSGDPAPDEEDEISPERGALIALVRWLGEDASASIPMSLHAQIREALGDDFYREVR